MAIQWAKWPGREDDGVPPKRRKPKAASTVVIARQLLRAPSLWDVHVGHWLTDDNEDGCLIRGPESQVYLAAAVLRRAGLRPGLVHDMRELGLGFVVYVRP